MKAAFQIPVREWNRFALVAEPVAKENDGRVVSRQVASEELPALPPGAIEKYIAAAAAIPGVDVIHNQQVVSDKLLVSGASDIEAIRRQRELNLVANSPRDAEQDT